jgi:voltage-gated potassium channel
MVRMRLQVRRSWLGPTLVGSLVLLVAGAGAVASLETGTVGSFWEGLWWAVSLMATVGFIGQPPATVPGAVLSVVLMLSGFVLLALVSAALASLFVREDVEPFEARERTADQEILVELRSLSDRIAALEAQLRDDREP